MASSRPKSRAQRAIEQAIISRIAWLVSVLARRLSLRAVRRLADGVAWVLMRLFPRRQRLAAANIAATFPDFTPQQVRAVREESVRSICRTLVELLKLPSMSAEQLRMAMDTRELERVLAAGREGRGLIVLSAHFGNWEWMGALLADAGLTTYVVARDAHHSLTARLVNDARASHGMKVIGREDLRGMMGALRRGEALGILPDQHALDGGVLIDFLGRPAWSFTGPALLAMRTGARVVPAFCPRLPDGTLALEVLPEVAMVDTGDREADLLTNTRRIHAAIETIIRRHPGQWLWLHDRWKQHPAAETTEATDAPD